MIFIHITSIQINNNKIIIINQHKYNTLKIMLTRKQHIKVQSEQLQGSKKGINPKSHKAVLESLKLYTDYTLAHW